MDVTSDKNAKSVSELSYANYAACHDCRPAVTGTPYNSAQYCRAGYIITCRGFVCICMIIVSPEFRDLLLIGKVTVISYDNCYLLLRQLLPLLPSIIVFGFGFNFGFNFSFVSVVRRTRMLDPLASEMISHLQVPGDSTENERRNGYHLESPF